MDNNLKNTFIKNTSWLMIGRIFQLVLTFVTTMLVTRYLGPEKYGTITYTYSYVALFLPLCTLGLNDIAVKELLDNKDNNGEILGTVFTLRFISSLCLIGLVYIVVKLFNDNPLFPYLALLQSLSLVFQIFDTLIYFYQSRLKAKKIGVVYIVAYSLASFFRIIGLIIKKGIGWFAFATSFEYLTLSLTLLIIYFIEGNKLTFKASTAKRLLNRSSSYIFAGIMVVIYSKADNIILGKMIDETSVGYYSAATTLCNAWPFLLTSIIEIANPIIIDLFNEDKEKYRKRIKQLYAAIFYIALVAGLGITVFSKLIIQIMYGSEYAPAVIPLRIVCWSTIFAYLGLSRSAWMQCENKLKYEATLSFMGAITNVILNLILIKLYGIVGAGVALLLTQFLTNVVYVYLIKDTRENAKLILDAIILNDIK